MGIVSKTISVQLQAEWLRIMTRKQYEMYAFNLGGQNEARNGLSQSVQNMSHLSSCE